ncbi:HTH_Tnp_Tc3_2 domain-containing protein [Trichonephila clavipes]|uniref:HTH_Tnp_Tc3_2 domain-containing protein n=1 Tax=Trichonephila clavipes TaxID=2585209 RepID=A0A8X6RMX7_TRICX|nr:HTH_Tnp_Tc3_2 domain-containing protein [Trichonephila clavipes]
MDEQLKALLEGINALKKSGQEETKERMGNIQRSQEETRKGQLEMQKGLENVQKSQEETKEGLKVEEKIAVVEEKIAVVEEKIKKKVGEEIERIKKQVEERNEGVAENFSLISQQMENFEKKLLAGGNEKKSNSVSVFPEPVLAFPVSVTTFTKPVKQSTYEGKTNWELNIAKVVGRSVNCIQKILQKFKKTGMLANNEGRGRKKIMNSITERRVIHQVKIDPKISAPKIAASTSDTLGRSVSAETVRRVLRKAGYNGRVARKKPLIGKRNRVKRLKFAKEHILKPQQFWNVVIFSDESKFNIFGSDGRRMVSRKPNTSHHPSYCEARRWVGDGLGVYGYVGGGKASIH